MDADQQQLMHESARVARAIHDLLRPDKINTATLGHVMALLLIPHITLWVYFGLASMPCSTRRWSGIENLPLT